VINAFGVDHPEAVSKKGVKAVKTLKRVMRSAKFKNAGGMFGSRGENKYGKDLPSAFSVGQKKGWSEGRGPMASGMRGFEYAVQHSPGTAAVAGATAVGGLGTAGYVGGRLHEKKR